VSLYPKFGFPSLSGFAGCGTSHRVAVVFVRTHRDGLLQDPSTLPLPDACNNGGGESVVIRASLCRGWDG
jgi:hypothetical protein